MITKNEFLATRKALQAIDPDKLQAAGATNIQMASPRSVRFDLPDGKGTGGINRVKITGRDDGTVDVRLIEVIEHDLIGGVAPDNLPGLLKTAVGLDVAK